MNYSSYDSVGLLALVCGGATKKIEKKERKSCTSGFKPKRSWWCGICPTIVLNQLPRSIKSHFCYKVYLTKWTSDTHTANSYKSDNCHIHDVQHRRTGTAVPSNGVFLIEILQCHDVWITILWLWWMVASLRWRGTGKTFALLTSCPMLKSLQSQDIFYQYQVSAL